MPQTGCSVNAALHAFASTLSALACGDLNDALQVAEHSGSPANVRYRMLKLLSLVPASFDTFCARSRAKANRHWSDYKLVKRSTRWPPNSAKTRRDPEELSGADQSSLALCSRDETYADPLSRRWMTRNGMIGAFQEQAFDIQPSTVGKPIYKEIKVCSRRTRSSARPSGADAVCLSQHRANSDTSALPDHASCSVVRVRRLRLTPVRPPPPFQHRHGRGPQVDSGLVCNTVSYASHVAEFKLRSSTKKPFGAVPICRRDLVRLLRP